MTIARIVVLLLVAGVGALVVATREVVAQWLVFGLYGLLLTLLFVVLQAPDAALAQAVVSGLVVPLLIVVVLAELRRRST